VIYTYIKFFLMCFFSSWFRRLSATQRCSPSCAALFDIAFAAVFIWFILKEQFQSITIWFRILLQCSFGSYWKINFSQSQIQSIIGPDLLKAWVIQWFRFHHNICRHFAIECYYMGVSLFAYSQFTFLAMLIKLLYLMYSINLNE
jgi:hypothetical protein